VDIGDRGEAAFDSGDRAGVGQVPDTDRDIGSEKWPRPFDGGPLNGWPLRRQSFFS
jgi:hypothetical protein